MGPELFFSIMVILTRNRFPMCIGITKKIGKHIFTCSKKLKEKQEQQQVFIETQNSNYYVNIKNANENT